MKCECGNSKFYGHQLLRADVIVDENGAFLDNLGKDLETSVYDAEVPYGPFTCSQCGKEHEELKQ